MESLKKIRTPLRSGFTRIANELLNHLENDDPDQDEIEVLMKQLDDRWDTLREKEQEIHDLLANDPKCSQETFDSEYNTYESYKEKYIRLKTKVDKILRDTVDDYKSVQSETVSKRRFKLPKVELKKFSGEVKEWLGFWGQFKKIHEDVEIPPEDKFVYLSQCTVPGSRAQQLVDSFPASPENYEQAIECLKARFGRDDLLIEVYVRELLSLVLNNSMSQRKVTRLSSLYDKLESHIRALNSLGVTSDKFASMLYPLVESSLDEETIRIWERSMSVKTEKDRETNKLTSLMSFLKTEVEGEERISIARDSFGFDARRKTKPQIPPPLSRAREEEQIPTAVGLFDASHSRTNKQLCAFCEKRNHESANCRYALKLNIEDRKKILIKKGSCFICLKVGHRARDCKVKISCERCKLKHHTIMCNESKQIEHNKLLAGPTEIKDAQAVSDTALSNRTCYREILLQTLYVRLRGKNEGKVIRCMIDSGSSRSYLTKRVAEEMQYDPLKEENIIHNLFGGKVHAEKHYRHRVFVSSISGQYHCNFEVLDQQTICSKIPTLKLGPSSQELKERNITVTDQLIAKKDESLDIDLLIGADVAGKLLNGKVIPLPCGLVAVGTHLGWTLMGKMPFDESDDNSTMVVTNLLIKDITITDLWNLDVIGITDPIAKLSREEKDLQIKMQFQNSVTTNNEGRYEVALPWADECLPLPTNKDLALKRLESATQKLQTQNLFTRYDDVFQNWKDLGMIEEVKQSDDIDSRHYLPHRPVVKENSSTPVRPVFDASARVKFSPSLNQCLESGPNLIELIPSLILRFRENQFGVVADIEKAFLQISIRESDRKFLRFFWWKNKDRKEIKTLQHTRVVFGLNCSPFLLGAVIDYHLKNSIENVEYDQKIIEKLRQSFYVDNVLASLDSKTELFRFIEESRKIMATAKFNLRCWQHSNDADPEVVTNLLGLLWNRKEDRIKLNLNWIKDQHIDKVTKRVILAMTHKVFDPVGIVSPVLLLPKLMLQNLWKTGMSWDTEVDEITKDKFLNWFRELTLLNEISIPRWIHSNKDKKLCSLHTFCDASGSAFAAVVYLRIQTDVATEVHLLSSKSRVTPVRQITIPRLELIAATVGARLCTSVLEGLKWQNVELYFWTDSTTVLTWIQKEEIWTVFVANRVREIRKLTNPDAWRHIKGIDNPADLPSRGCSAKQLLTSRWWEGPAWLRKNEDEWPKSNLILNREEITREMRKTVIAAYGGSSEGKDWFYRYFSSFPKILRLIAWILRFLKNVRKSEVNKETELSFSEIQRAERTVLMLIQKESLAQIEEKLKNLSYFVDEYGVIRVKTQVMYRQDDTDDFKFPALLPSEHPVVHLLISWKHKELLHAGVSALMSNLREQYWIIKARKTIRKVVHRCVRCKRFNAKKTESVPIALPADRVQDVSVFQVIGVDLAGPLYLKKSRKSWIVLYTCAVYRAVHLEIVTSLSTESFLQSFRRFIARRGRPTTVYSDNGTNFVGACSAFSAIDWTHVSSVSALQKIQWKFNPPSAAWWGGWWERLIQLVKRILRRVLGRAVLSYEELLTVLCDCEQVINARPLTYVTEDAEDLSPLTPAMFLQTLRSSDVKDIDLIDCQRLNKRLRHVQKVREHLRKRFRIEYLGQLKQSKNLQKNVKELSVNDVVLVESDTKRAQWALARIVELFPGKDGHHRVARVKTQSGEFTRPVQRLYNLEVQRDSSAEPITRTRSGRQIIAPDRLCY